MQESKGIIGSLSESLDFDNVSTPNNTILGQPIFWNDVRNSPENGLSGFMHLNDGVPPLDQERHGTGYWNIEDPGPSFIRNERNHNGKKSELLFSSSSGQSVGSGSQSEEARCEQTNLTQQYIHGQSSEAISQNLNLNSTFVDPSGFKTGGADSARSSCTSSFIPSRSGRLIQSDSEERAGCSMNARRQSCKRKAIEDINGQSSVSGSSTFFQSPESSSWSQFPGGIPPSHSGIPRLGLGLRSGSSEVTFSSSTAIQPEGSHRNFRLRMSPSTQHVSSNPFFPNGTSATPHQFSNHYDPRSSLVATANQNQPTVLPLSSLQHNVQSLREEVNPRNFPTNLLDHPIHLPMIDPRSTSRNLTPRNIGSNVASSSRAVPHPLPGASWIPPPPVSSRNSRRLAEFVRRSLHLHPSSEEPFVATNPLPHRPFPRSSSWIDGQSNSLLGIPYTLRNLPPGNEGRRHVSEQIRNVLDLMRRGEGLRFEDVMFLDHPLLFGVADVHDRHRDMRLDVDNMSYEELLALEERIGNVSTGLTEENIDKQLKERTYFDALQAEMGTEPCCVCQEEYDDGERLGTLDCGHNFHTDCIKQWLKVKNWCPICKTTGLSS